MDMAQDVPTARIRNTNTTKTKKSVNTARRLDMAVVVLIARQKNIGTELVPISVGGAETQVQAADARTALRRCMRNSKHYDTSVTRVFRCEDAYTK